MIPSASCSISSMLPSNSDYRLTLPMTAMLAYVFPKSMPTTAGVSFTLSAVSLTAGVWVPLASGVWVPVPGVLEPVFFLPLAIV
jgi:hypothetical protein